MLPGLLDLHLQEVADIIMDVIAESSNDFKDCKPDDRTVLVIKIENA
ncbi:MAG: hypothetical protein LRZ91_04875 [Desulfotomaculum sp.]|jgi:hypothetical protein|nr:hypothetical protein [Desulfotomaculum sp.]MCL0032320.1 hypothetical protein [Peptococcaceae bacterium]MCL0041769.1 hypothetical protein [Peptococcaceae bacterium]MCL0107633.1 hypothetical protein [Peptococcaceae bacterium]